MHFISLFVISVLFLSILSESSAEGKDYEIVNLPKRQFVFTKSLLNSDDEFNQKVAKELGKVSDDVKHFLEKVMRVAKSLVRDWLLTNEDGSDPRNSK